MQHYHGSGGKGSSSSNKQDIADVTGISNDRAEIVLGICEGAVESLGATSDDLAKRIYLDGTPIQNSDGTKNFEGLNFAFYSGTINQPFLPGSSGNEIATPTNVGVVVTQSTSASRTITNLEINSIRIRLAVRLQKQESDGDIKEESLTVKISVKEGSGAFNLRVQQTIKGRYPDYTVFPYLLNVTRGVSSFVVKVEKVGEDSSSDGKTIRDLQWLTYEEVIAAQLQYPNTAVMWIQYPPKLFKSAPTVTIKMTGGWLAQIPVTASIASDRGLDFSNSAWNGTFYRAGLGNTDPAWLLWGYLTDKIWGLGIDPQYIDRYAFYQASLYNNQIISNGFGGTERRFSFRGQLTVGGDGEDRFETARQIAACFAAKIFHNGIQYTIWQDRPVSTIPRIVANADVVDGVFLGTTQEFNAIATACMVWRVDPDQDYEEVPEPVEYPSAVKRYGYRPEEFKTLGETRRGGAVRAARRVILSSLPSQTEGEIGQISFKVRAFGLFFELGDVVQIADSSRNPDRKSGLIKSATASQIILDAQVSILNGAQLLCTLPNMTTETRTVTQSQGTYSTLNVNIPYSQIPQSQASWQIIDGATIFRKYRIINVSPDVDNGNLYEITAKLYIESRYAEIESNWSLTAYDQVQRSPTVVPPPRNVQAFPLVITSNGVTTYTLGGQWDYPIRQDGQRETYVISYYIEFKRGINGEWGNRQATTNQTVRYESVGFGNFYIRVAAQTVDGKTSAWIESSIATLDQIATSTSNDPLLLLLLEEEELN